tara:strand:+ start:252 stop:449 length:198 start_codon:yes stop_codon:yes gene_type:complete
MVKIRETDDNELSNNIMDVAVTILVEQVLPMDGNGEFSLSFSLSLTEDSLSLCKHSLAVTIRTGH